MASKVKTNNDAIAEINIIPFVDILLVILIIFLVAAPLAQKAMDIKLSKATSATQLNQPRITVGISKNGKVTINGRVTQMNELKAVISQLNSKGKMVKAVIAADQAASHGQVVQVIDAVKSGGVSDFAISVGN